MMKRITAALLSLVMAASVFTACGDEDKDGKKTTLGTSTFVTTADPNAIDYDKLVIPEMKLVVDGEEVDTSDLVVMTINGKYDVTFDVYRCFYFNSIATLGVDFSTLEGDAKEETFEAVKEYTESYLKDFYLNFILADNNGIDLGTDLDNEVEVQYQSLVTQHGSEENLEKLMLSEYFTENAWRELSKGDLVSSKLYDALYGEEGGTLYVSKDEFKELTKTDEYARVKHILVTYSSQAELSDEDMEGYDDLTLSAKLQKKETAYAALSEDEVKAVNDKAKAVAEAALVKVQAGEDFDSLITEYGWDPGMETLPEGYCMTKETSFVEEFIEAAFALKVGETSGVVESDYGYHILKREPVEEDYVEENLDDLYDQYFGDMVNYTYYEMRDEILETMEITYCDEYSKFTADSIS